ncbi:MAG TPA: hypothetical protein G4N96_06295, partial [Chloroflexi bacterium]|nr:hypothetical protein [Chloroflexota bacterium]
MFKQILSRIREWFAPDAPVKDVPYRVNRLSNVLAQESTRRELMTASEAMAAADPRIMAVITKLAADATRGGFDFVAEDETVTQVISDLTARLNLQNLLPQWLFEAQMSGDLFLEVSLQGNEIAAVTLKPPVEMVRLSDLTDRFPDPQRAYNQAEFQFGFPTSDNGIFLAAWQIVHARWNRRANERYGRPQFATAVDHHKWLLDGERNLAIRRRLRSGTRLYHHVPGSAAQIMAYREMNQEAIDAGSEAVVLDYFGNSETGPKAIQLDESLGEIGDILHQLQTAFSASPVPIELLGYGHDLNRDLLEEKLKSYEDALPAVTDWIEKQVLEPLVDLQLLLLGIWPGNVKYEILWARDRQSEAELAQQSNDAVRARSEAVVLDYFGNSETGPKAIQLDESLGEISDILHQL